MTNEISEEIIEEVKKALNITTEIDNIALLKKLSAEYTSSHPDNFLDKENKEIAEERFKLLGSLRNKLRSYLENQRAKGQLIAYDNSHDIAEIETINILTEKDLEILSLKDNISYLELTLEITKRELKDKEKVIDDFLHQSTKTSKEEITDIYKPKKRGRILGLGSAIATLSLFIPQVQNIVETMGVGGVIGSSIIVCVTIIWLLQIVRNDFCNNCIQSLIDKILYGDDLVETFNVTFPKERFSKPFFKEKDVVNSIDRYMNFHKYHLLFWGKYNSIRRQIVEYILLELSRKKIIVDMKTHAMQKIFFVEHSNIVDL